MIDINKERCANVEKCPFFIEYSGNTSLITNAWITNFCENESHSDNCKRKQYKQQHGTPPPPNMTPTGVIM